MLQDLRPTLIILHIPLVTEQDDKVASQEIAAIQRQYNFFGRPYQAVESHYDESCHRKFYMDPIYRRPGPKSVPMYFLPECDLSAQHANWHLQSARSVLCAWPFSPEDIRRLFRALDVRITWQLFKIEAEYEMKREAAAFLQ